MKITKKWLAHHGACEEGMEWFMKQRCTSIESVVGKLIKERRFVWANWTVTKAMTHKQAVRYACFASLLYIKNFETECPTDNRPRRAIESALKWVNCPNEYNRLAAKSAARSAALAAARWASAARWVPAAVAESAWFAARSAALVASEARSESEESARSAVWSSARWAPAAVAWKIILAFGLKLLIKNDAKGLPKCHM